MITGRSILMYSENKVKIWEEVIIIPTYNKVHPPKCHN